MSPGPTAVGNPALQARLMQSCLSWTKCEQKSASPRPARALPACPAGMTLGTASHAAWAEGTARIGPAGPPPGLSRLVHVRVTEPVQREAVTRLALGWGALGASERLFPVLDADITLIPDGMTAR